MCNRLKDILHVIKKYIYLKKVNDKPQPKSLCHRSTFGDVQPRSYFTILFSILRRLTSFRVDAATSQGDIAAFVTMGFDMKYCSINHK